MNQYINLEKEYFLSLYSYETSREKQM